MRDALPRRAVSFVGAFGAITAAALVARLCPGSCGACGSCQVALVPLGAGSLSVTAAVAASSLVKAKTRETDQAVDE
jgi:hypothetical protein